MLNDNITWVWPNIANMKEMDCDQGNEWDELWWIKWMRRTTVDEMNGIDFYIKNTEKMEWWYDNVTICWWQDDGTRWLHSIPILLLMFWLCTIKHIEMVWLLFLLIDMCISMFYKVQLHSLEVWLLLQVNLMMFNVFFGLISLALSWSLSCSVLQNLSSSLWDDIYCFV